MTREDWLGQLLTLLRPAFAELDTPLPEKIRVSCGFPSKQALAKNQRIGECWSSTCSGDQSFELFVSPMIQDATVVSATLVHEACHAAVGVECGHKKEFKDIAKAIGLEGKMTSTTASEALALRLHDLCEQIGPYPHAKLTTTPGIKKQVARMLKVVCPECGCLVRMTRQWLEDAGTPTCACGTKMREDDDE